jgi:hypothetical protein
MANEVLVVGSIVQLTAEEQTGRWHNPEDDEDDYAEPTHWAFLNEPKARPDG